MNVILNKYGSMVLCKLKIKDNNLCIYITYNFYYIFFQILIVCVIVPTIKVLIMVKLIILYSHEKVTTHQFFELFMSVVFYFNI